MVRYRVFTGVGTKLREEAVSFCNAGIQLGEISRIISVSEIWDGYDLFITVWYES